MDEEHRQAENPGAAGEMPAEPESRRREQRMSPLGKGLLVCALMVAAVLAAALLLRAPDIVRDEVRMEAGSEIPEASAFLKEEGHTAVWQTDVSQLDTTLPGKYPVVIEADGEAYDTVLAVEDTVPPEGEACDASVWVGEECLARDFIRWSYDVSGVRYAFAGEEPDTEKVGFQDVELVLLDAAGNRTTLTASLMVKRDITPPKIEGVETLFTTVGGTVSYKQGVTVTDDRDEEIALEIDNSRVDLNTPGEYEAVYSATDSAGNRTEESCYVVVKNEDFGEPDRDRMEELAQRAVASCVREDMTDLQKLHAIFWYVKNNMNYVNASDKTTQIEEAIRGFTDGTGDCFTYFSTMKAMLEAAGFETMDVEREEGARETHHYWSLVKYNGEWYHIDACARSAEHHSEWYCFLRTDAEVADFTENMVEGYYQYNKELYPDSAAEPLNLPDYQLAY